MSGTFGAPTDADGHSLDRILQLKRIQRRAGTAAPVALASESDDWTSWGPQGKAPGTLDGPLSPATVGSRGVSSNGVSAEGLGMLKALRDTVRFLQSTETETAGFVDPRSFSTGGAHVAEAMEELLRELEALKSRDASSATVLRMAKDNLEQRKQQISELQAELTRRTEVSESMTDLQAEKLQAKDQELQQQRLRTRTAEDRVDELNSALTQLQADADAHAAEEARLKAQHTQDQEEMRELREVIQKHQAEIDTTLALAAQEVGFVHLSIHASIYLSLSVCLSI